MTAARRIVLLCLACALAAPAAALAQGAFAGVVKDASGAVLPGVTVEARSAVLIEGARAVVTDGNGQYQIVDLRPGTYALSFTLPGFSAVKREALELAGARIVTIDVQLTVGGVQETVTVAGQSPLVDVQNVQRQRVIGKDVIDAMNTISTTASNCPATRIVLGGYSQGAAVAAYTVTGSVHLLPLAPSAIWLGAAVAVTEIAVPPALVLLNVLTEQAVDPAVLTQAFTWNNSASAAGVAAAASLAGHAADAWGPPTALAQAPAAALVLLILSLVLSRAARQVTP